MTVHDFAERLAYSHDQADEPWWEHVYRQAFPDMAAMVDLRHDGWHQRAGRDRAVILTNGRAVYVDEKSRARDYGDFLLEVWSQYPKEGAAPFPPVQHRSKPGWAVEPKDCDWVAYAIVPRRTCYLLPFLGIRAAWVKHGAKWVQNATGRRESFAWRLAENRDYQTVSISMPLAVIRDCINDAMTLTWDLGDN